VPVFQVLFRLFANEFGEKSDAFGILEDVDLIAFLPGHFFVAGIVDQVAEHQPRRCPFFKDAGPSILTFGASPEQVWTG
jgi:hypothetical protein